MTLLLRVALVLSVLAWTVGSPVAAAQEVDVMNPAWSSSTRKLGPVLVLGMSVGAFVPAGSAADAPPAIAPGELAPFCVAVDGVECSFDCGADGGTATLEAIGAGSPYPGSLGGPWLYAVGTITCSPGGAEESRSCQSFSYGFGACYAEVPSGGVGTCAAGRVGGAKAQVVLCRGPDVLPGATFFFGSVGSSSPPPLPSSPDMILELGERTQALGCSGLSGHVCCLIDIVTFNYWGQCGF